MNIIYIGGRVQRSRGPPGSRGSLVDETTKDLLIKRCAMIGKDKGDKSEEAQRHRLAGQILGQAGKLHELASEILNAKATKGPPAAKEEGADEDVQEADHDEVDDRTEDDAQQQADPPERRRRGGRR
jgi:hypothetical protein